MKCIECGNIIDDSSKFCTYCGAPQSIFENLVDRALNNDQKAIAELYGRTAGKVKIVVKCMVKDEDMTNEIVQEAYVKGFSKLRQLNDANKFLPWMKTIARNQANDHFRKHKKEKLVGEFLPMNEMEAQGEMEIRAEMLPELVMDQKETVRLLREILDKLPGDQRLLIYEYYYEQKSVKDIAEQLGISENTVKSKLAYGRKKVELQVRALEKEGTKLYSLAPIPFLVALLRTAEENLWEMPASTVFQAVKAFTAEAVAEEAAGTVAGEAMHTAASEATKVVAKETVKTATKVAAEEAVKAGAGVAMKGVIAKGMAVVLTTAVLGGGAVTGKVVAEHIYEERQEAQQQEASVKGELTEAQKQAAEASDVQEIPSDTQEKTSEVQKTSTNAQEDSSDVQVTPSDTQEKPSEVPALTPTPTLMPQSESFSMPEQYMPIVDDGIRAIRENWDFEKSLEMNRGENFTSDVMKAVGYTLMDLDENGTPELVIAAPSQNNNIIHLYTLKDGICSEVIYNEFVDQRMNTYICEGGVLYSYCNHDSWWPKIRYDRVDVKTGDGMNKTTIELLHEDVNNPGQWFYTTDNSIPLEEWQSIPSEDVEKIKSKYVPIDLKLTMFADLVSGNSQAEQKPTVEQAQTQQENPKKDIEKYDSILDKYFYVMENNINESFEPEYEMIPWYLGNLEELNGYGYAMKDLDKDGVNELIIVNTTDFESLQEIPVVGAYTIRNGEVKAVVIRPTELGPRYVCENGLFLWKGGVPGSGGEEFNYYKITDKTEGNWVRSDKACSVVQKNGQWLYGASRDDVYSSGGISISEEDARKIIDNNKILKLKYSPLSDLYYNR